MQRSFLSDAARDLGIKAEQYHRRLYQDRRTAQLQLRALARNLPAAGVVFAIVLAGAIAVLAGLAGVSSIFTGTNFVGQIKATGATLLPAAGVVALITAVAKAFFDASAVQIQESAMGAAEQFRSALTDLIQEGLDRRRPRRWGWFGPRVRDNDRDRVLFFVDELDRVAPEEVVEALRALKTFLEVPGSVFVVAADRDVLESALDRLPRRPRSMRSFRTSRRRAPSWTRSSSTSSSSLRCAGGA